MLDVNFLFKFCTSIERFQKNSKINKNSIFIYSYIWQDAVHDLEE